MHIDLSGLQDGRNDGPSALHPDRARKGEPEEREERPRMRAFSLSLSFFFLSLSVLCLCAVVSLAYFEEVARSEEGRIATIGMAAQAPHAVIQHTQRNTCRGTKKKKKKTESGLADRHQKLFLTDSSLPVRTRRRAST